MDSFIKLSNFGKIAPYAQLFWQGLLVTSVIIYSCDRFRACTDPCSDAYVKHPSVPCSGGRQ